MPQCRGCGKEILFIKTGNGKKQPVNPEPVYVKLAAGGKPYITKNGMYIYGTIAGDALDDPDTNLVKAYESHFATCPEANNFRRK